MSTGLQIGPYVLKHALPQVGPFGGKLFEAARKPKQLSITAFLDRQSGCDNSEDAFPTSPLVVVELLDAEPDLANIPGGFTALMKTLTNRGYAVFYPIGGEPTTQADAIVDSNFSLAVEVRPIGDRLGAHYKFNTLPSRGTLIARLVEGPGEPGQLDHEPLRLTNFLASGHISWPILRKSKRIRVQVGLEEPSVAGEPRVLCSCQVEVPSPRTLFWRNSPKGIALWASRRIEDHVELAATLRGGGHQLLSTDNIPVERESLCLLPTGSPVMALDLARTELQRWICLQFAGASRAL